MSGHTLKNTDNVELCNFLFLKSVKDKKKKKKPDIIYESEYRESWN